MNVQPKFLSNVIRLLIGTASANGEAYYDIFGLIYWA